MESCKVVTSVNEECETVFDNSKILTNETAEGFVKNADDDQCGTNKECTFDGHVKTPGWKKWNCSLQRSNGFDNQNGDEDQHPAANELYLEGFVKAPGTIKLNGQLQQTNGVDIFSKLRPKLVEVQKMNGNESLIYYLKQKFHHRTGPYEDLAILELNIGMYLAGGMANDTSKAHKEFKIMEQQIANYKLQNPNIILGLLYYNLSMSYFMKGPDKLGKADIYLQKGKQVMQFNAPSTYTSYILHIEAQLSIMMAQQKMCSDKNRRKRICSDAVRCYSKARDQWMCQLANNNLFFPVYYMMQMVYILLDMPTVYAMTSFQHSPRSIALEYGETCTPSYEDVLEAEKLISIVKQDASTLASRCQITIKGWIALGNTYLALRKTQLTIKSNTDAVISLGNLQNARETYQHWWDMSKNSPFSRNKWMQKLKVDLEKLLAKEEINIKKMICPFKFTSEDEIVSSDVM